MQHLKRLAKNWQLNRRGRVSNFYQVGEDRGERGIAHAGLKKKKKIYWRKTIGKWRVNVPHRPLQGQPPEANNPKNDDYCLNNLASLQRVQLPLHLEREDGHATLRADQLDFEERTAMRLQREADHTTWKRDPDCLSLIPTRPTTSSVTTTWTASPLREFNFLSIKRDQKVRAFNGLFVIHSKRSAFSGDPACSLLTLLRPITPKTKTTCTTSPLFRELNFLPIKRDQKVQGLPSSSLFKCYVA